MRFADFRVSLSGFSHFGSGLANFAKLNSSLLIAMSLFWGSHICVFSFGTLLNWGLLILGFAYLGVPGCFFLFANFVCSLKFADMTDC